MNKEVKEIIDDIKDFIKDKKQIVCYGKETMKILLDYITSLEEKLETEHKAYMGTVKELTETATRIDKAVEYIENNLQSFLYSIEYKTLMNILKGSDKNE